MTDVGGTPGGLGEFALGFIMTCVGGYLISNQVTVVGSYWSFWGANSFGVTLIPLLFGLPLLFWPLHIAFLEMVIDPVCSIVFEAEGEEADTMRRPPRPPTAPLFTAAADEALDGSPRCPRAVPGTVWSASTGGCRHRISGVGTGTMALASPSTSVRV